MSSMRLNDKVALITGGGSGIGFATARLFIEEGARCIIIGRSAEKLRTACEKLGPHAMSVVADVAKAEDLRKAVEESVGSHGRIDVLFANAGISECPSIVETTEKFFDEIVGTNLKGIFFLFKAAQPYLSDGASVIFTGSVGALKGGLGDPLYCATKAAVRALGRSLALEPSIASRNIRVNTITPGPIRTPLTAAAHSDGDVSRYIQAQVPLGRWGEPEEVANTALFLASPLSSFITGSEILVDGGLAQA